MPGRRTASAIVARTVSATWCGTGSVPRRAQGKPRSAAPRARPPRGAAGRDEPRRLVAHHARHQRRLRVVDDGAVLVVDPALPVRHGRADQRQTKGGDAVDQATTIRVELLALPGEPVGSLTRQASVPLKTSAVPRRRPPAARLPGWRGRRPSSSPFVRRTRSPSSSVRVRDSRCEAISMLASCPRVRRASATSSPSKVARPFLDHQCAAGRCKGLAKQRDSQEC